MTNDRPARTIEVWDRIAGFWDDHLKDGNDFQLNLIMPTTDRLLAGALGGLAGRRVLDACCGNGNYARRLAGVGSRVTAFDGSAVFIERAKARTPADLSIDYRTLDATDAVALREVDAAGPFDAVVCSMALMDLADLAPLLSAARRWLAAGGPFVFSVCHPCFNATGVRMTAELRTDAAGRSRQHFGVAAETYLTPREDASEGIMNQPEPHPIPPAGVGAAGRMLRQRLRRRRVRRAGVRARHVVEKRVQLGKAAGNPAGDRGTAAGIECMISCGFSPTRRCRGGTVSGCNACSRAATSLVLKPPV